MKIVFFILIYFFSFSAKAEGYINPIIISLSGKTLTEVEKNNIKKLNPVGFILLGYNMKDKEQVKNLIKDIKKTLGRKNVLFMIDQEGGRVNRLKNIFPNKKYPSPYTFGIIAENDLELAKRKIHEYSKSVALDLKELSINLVLAPVLDVLEEKSEVFNGENNNNQKRTTSDVGDRAFSKDKNIVAELGKDFIRGVEEQKIFTCPKHLIGLGPSTVDSHKKLPIITKTQKELEKDIYPFKYNNNTKFALVGLAKYTAIDERNISIFSKDVIKIIREAIGFNGFLISDDLLMGALNGYSLKERILMSLDAGIDIVLYLNDVSSNERFIELRDIISNIPTTKIIEFNNNFQKSIKFIY